MLYTPYVGLCILQGTGAIYTMFGSVGSQLRNCNPLQNKREHELKCFNSSYYFILYIPVYKISDTIDAALYGKLSGAFFVNSLFFPCFVIFIVLQVNQVL